MENNSLFRSDDMMANSPAPDEQQDGSVRGRAAFLVDMSKAGLVVRTAFVTEQNQAMDMPAVFPDLQYALAQIDSLRQIVIDRFAQAAQIGIQVMAAQATANNKQPEVASGTDAPVPGEVTSYQ
jgi:hypothetical protein